MDENGSITPYLIITLTASLLILFMLIDFGRVNYLKNETRRNGKLAIESELALYNSELRNEYGLFGCIKQEDFEVEEDVKSLIEKNISPSKVDNFEIKSCELIDELTLMDDEELERQIDSYMKFRNIECDFENVISILNSSKDKQKEIKKEKLNPCTEEEYAEIESYKEKDNREEASRILNSNDEKEDIILKYDYDFEEDGEVSLEEFSQSSEELIEDYEASLTKNKLVNYVMLVFNNSQNIKHENRFWNAEAEFIISGSNSQNKNVDNTYEKIRMLLLPERLLEVYTDDARKSEAELIALATCGWWSGEVGVTIAKNAILVAMAVCDTENDLASLKCGYCVQLLKGFDVYLNYEDFLRLLLTFERKEVIYDRIRVLIDSNLKEVNGLFDIKKVKTGMLFKVTARSKFIFTTSIPNAVTKLNEFEFEENVFGVY